MVLGLYSYGQERIINNLSSNPSYVNPSYHAFREPTKIGVLTEFASSQAANVSQHQYAYATTYFDQYNFQLALDMFSSKLSNSGFGKTTAALTYIYQLQLDNNWYFYPGISVGYSTYKVNFGNLVFSDQIDILTGQVNTFSNDPIVSTENIGFIDMSASAMFHNDFNFSGGISIKHLNQAKISSELYEETVNQKMLISLQAAYEFNLNKYQQGRLPNFSYLYLFSAFTKHGPNTRFDLYQDFILSNFLIGVNEHFSSLDSVGLNQVGFTAGLVLDSIEIGFNYMFPLGQSQFAAPKSFEIYATFDLSPFRIRNRKDFSRFY